MGGGGGGADKSLPEVGLLKKEQILRTDLQGKGRQK